MLASAKRHTFHWDTKFGQRFSADVPKNMTMQAFMGHRSIANTLVYTSVADKRIRNIWGK